MEKPFFDSDKLQVEVFSLDDSTFESSELSFLNQNLEKFDQIFPETSNLTTPLSESITPSHSIEQTSPKFKEFSNDIDQIFSEFDREVSRILTPASIDSTNNIQGTPYQDTSCQDTPYINIAEEIQTPAPTESLDISGFSFKEPENTDNLTDEPILEESNFVGNNDISFLDIIDDIATDDEVDEVIEESNDINNDVTDEVADEVADEIVIEDSIEEVEEDVIDDVDNDVVDIIEENNDIDNDVTDEIADEIVIEDSIEEVEEDVIDDVVDIIEESNDINNDVTDEVADEIVIEDSIEEVEEDVIDDVDNDVVDIIEENNDIDNDITEEVADEIVIEDSIEEVEEDVIDDVDNDVVEEIIIEDIVDNVESNEVAEVVEIVEESEMQRMGISSDMLSQLNSAIPSSSGESFTQLTKDEVRELMINIDNLLEFLPEEKIEELSQQDFYHNYIKFLDDLEV